MSRSLTVTSSLSALPGVYTLTQKATNSSNTALTASASATYTVSSITQPPPPTGTTPVVTITKPVEGKWVTTAWLRQWIDVSATDADGVKSIKIFVDNIMVKECLNTTLCTGSVLTASLTLGTHTVRAEATDALGNKGTATVNFVRK